jgi:hypothetical protein
MNTISNRQFMWTKEAVNFIMADLQWKATDLEIRVKSPYPSLFFYYIESNIAKQPEILPQTNPNP